MAPRVWQMTGCSHQGLHRSTRARVLGWAGTVGRKNGHRPCHDRGPLVGPRRASADAQAGPLQPQGDRLPLGLCDARRQGRGVRGGGLEGGADAAERGPLARGFRDGSKLGLVRGDMAGPDEFRKALAAEIASRCGPPGPWAGRVRPMPAEECGPVGGGRGTAAYESAVPPPVGMGTQRRGPRSQPGRGFLMRGRPRPASTAAAPPGRRSGRAVRRPPAASSFRPRGTGHPGGRDEGRRCRGGRGGRRGEER